MKNIIVNKARCIRCGDILISEHRYDFKQCKCKAISVYGGTDYIRRVGKLEYVEELSEYEESNEVIRESLLVIDRLKVGNNTSVIIAESNMAIRIGSSLVDENGNKHKVLSIAMVTAREPIYTEMLLLEGDYKGSQLYVEITV